MSSFPLEFSGALSQEGDPLGVLNLAICCWRLVFLEGFSQGAVWDNLK